MTEFTQKQAHRRYIRTFVVTMGLYLIGLFGGTIAWALFEDPPLWASLAALAAATVPLLFFLLAWLRYVKEADEYQRFQQLWAFAIAGCVTAAVCFVMGFGRVFEVLPHIDAYWYGVIFIVVQGIANGIRVGRRVA